MTELIETALAQSLEAIEMGGKTVTECLQEHPEIRGELEDLLLLASTLRDTTDLAADPEFQAKLRQRIIDHIQEHSPALVTSRNMGTLRSVINAILMRPMLRLALATLLVVVLLSGGVIYASAQALPGDLLYPVKTIIEEIRLNILGEGAKHDLHKEFAEKRLIEIEGLIDDGRYEYLPLAVGSYITSVDVATGTLLDDEVQKWEVIEEKGLELDQNLARHIEILIGLMDKLPPQALPAIEHAIEASSKGKEKLEERFPDGLPGGGQKPESPPVQEKPEPEPPGPPEGAGPPTQANPQGAPGQPEPPQGTPGPPPKDN